MELINIYTDGSFQRKIMKGAWAFVVLDKDNNITHQNKGLVEDDSNSIWQVGSEIRAVKEAIKYCKENNFRAVIHYDLKNLYLWVADLFGDKPWKAGNKWSQEYREFVIENKNYIHSFKKIKGHSNDFGNDLVDALAATVFE